MLSASPWAEPISVRLSGIASPFALFIYFHQMRLSFLRHNKLVPPYHDYSALSYSEFADLGSCRVSPEASREYSLTDHARGLVSDGVDAVLRSPQRRVADSLGLLGFPTGKVLDDLDEIRFDLRKVLPEADFQAGGLGAVRQALLFAWSADKGFLFRMDDRVDRIAAEAVSVRVGRVLCGTHGFLMRFLWLRFVCGKRAVDLSYGDLALAKNCAYLDGFSVNI